MDDLLSPFHIVILAIVAVLVFGPSRLPELGGAVGRTIQAFRASLHQPDTPAADRRPEDPAAARPAAQRRIPDGDDPPNPGGPGV